MEAGQRHIGMADKQRHYTAQRAARAEGNTDMTAQATGTSTALDNTAKMLRHAKRLARKVLTARDAEAQARKDIDGARDDLAWLAEQLGLTTIEAVAGRGVQIVRPVGRKVIGNDDLVKAIARHRPEWLDTLAPAKRTVSLDALSKAIDAGDVPASWRKHIAETAGTVQLRAVNL